MVVFSLGAVATALGGIIKFADNKITAYFLVIAVLLLDAGQGALFGNAGLIGSFFGFVISQMTGGQVNLIVMSIHLLFLFAISPVVFFALSKSGRR